MPDIEAVGDAVTGGLVARAVEPGAGEADGHTHERLCLNCGSALTGPYCHQCGQKAHVHRTLSAFGHDLAHGVLHLDGKIWNTLPLLAWRPGELTRRYVHGERARFVSPMALFLFSVFLMFAILSVGGGIRESNQVVAGTSDNGRLEAELKRSTDAEKAKLQKLQQERQQRAEAGLPTASVDSQIREKQAEIAITERMTRGFIADEDSVATVDLTRSADGNLSLSTGSKRLDAWFVAAYEKARENPTLLLYKVQSNAYKFSWLLIPISIPLVWLLFLHRRRYRQQFTAYDHTVFVTYSIAFMSLALVTLTLLDWIGFPSLVFALGVLLVPPVHMYRQLKDAYALSRRSALWRTAALLIMALAALLLFAAILLAVGVFG